MDQALRAGVLWLSPHSIATTQPGLIGAAVPTPLETPERRGQPPHAHSPEAAQAAEQQSGRHMRLPGGAVNPSLVAAVKAASGGPAFWHPATRDAGCSGPRLAGTPTSPVTREAVHQTGNPPARFLASAAVRPPSPCKASPPPPWEGEGEGEG